MTNLTRRAYRRPVTGADMEAPLAFYQKARQNGETFDAGIRAGLARVLSSPLFIYRMEGDAARAGRPSHRPASRGQRRYRPRGVQKAANPDRGGAPEPAPPSTSERLREPRYHFRPDAAAAIYDDHLRQMKTELGL